MNPLLELAERVAAAMGPDRELDCLIWCALNGYAEITYPDKAQDFSQSGRVEAKGPDGLWKLLGWIDPGKVQRNWLSYGGDSAYPAYTASLDAAMMLVPEGYGWRLWAPSSRQNSAGDLPRVTLWGGGRSYAPNDTEAATPALALVAASLRARATLPARLGTGSGEGL